MNKRLDALEPGAGDCGVVMSDHAAWSIAVSLKRIADAMTAKAELPELAAPARPAKPTTSHPRERAKRG